MRRLWLPLTSLAFLLAVAPAHATPPGKLDARTRAALARLHSRIETVDEMRRAGAAIDAGGSLDVLIRGSASRQELEAAGARVRSGGPGIFELAFMLSLALFLACAPRRRVLKRN